MTRAAKPAPAGPSNSTALAVKVPLSQLRGIDRCNPRKVLDDVSGLAASLRAEGQQNALIVRPVAGGMYDVLAGGRRFRALCEIGAADPHRRMVEVKVFNGDDNYARGVALAENFARSSLHPLDEAEAFAAEVRHKGLDQVASDYGLAPAALLKRLALAQLSERVQQIWREGRIDLPAAQAFTATRDVAAQDALLDAPDAESLLKAPAEIRKRLTEGWIPASAAIALFVVRYLGIDAYLAAGGVVVQSFFDVEVYFADAKLLRTMARTILSDAALALRMSEHWGFALWDEGWTGYDQVEPDYIPDETARRADLDRELLQPGLSADAVEAILRELEKIERAAFLRAVPQSERHRYGAHLSWDSDGRLAVERGLVRRLLLLADRADNADPSPRFAEPPAPSPTETPDNSGPEDFSASAAAAVSPPRSRGEGAGGGAGASPRRRPLYVPALDAPLAPAARRVAERAASLAVAEFLASRPYFAIVATIASAIVAEEHRRPVRIKRELGPFSSVPGWMLRSSRMTFPDALREGLAHAPDELIDPPAMLLAFASLAASSIDLRGADGDYAAALLAEVAARFPALPELIAENLDYPAFFREASRATALLALRDCGGDGMERSHAWRDDDGLAKEAELIAKDKSWLPEFLRTRARPSPLAGEGRGEGPGRDAPATSHDEPVA